MNDITVVPPSPFGTPLRGQRQIALYLLGRDDKQAVRKVAALISEVRPENRLPFTRLGDGSIFSFTYWIDTYLASRAKHLVAVDSPAGNEPSTTPPSNKAALKGGSL